MTSHTILVADDDTYVVNIVRLYLQDDYHVVTSLTGEGLLELIARSHPHLVVLDIMLPGKDGLSLLRAIRMHSDVPVILLTACSQESDVVTGFAMGADDYVSKPFSPRELQSRIHSVLRRSESLADPAVCAFGELQMNRGTHHVTIGVMEVELTRKEFDILWTMTSNPGRVFTRSHLLEALSDYDSQDRTIDVHMMNIRKKLQDSGIAIETVYGLGYRLEEIRR